MWVSVKYNLCRRNDEFDLMLLHSQLVGFVWYALVQLVLTQRPVLYNIYTTTINVNVRTIHVQAWSIYDYQYGSYGVISHH